MYLQINRHVVYHEGDKQQCFYLASMLNAETVSPDMFAYNKHILILVIY